MYWKVKYKIIIFPVLTLKVLRLISTGRYNSFFNTLQIYHYTCQANTPVCCLFLLFFCTNN